jgi:hypothetical protein
VYILCESVYCLVLSKWQEFLEIGTFRVVLKKKHAVKHSIFATSGSILCSKIQHSPWACLSESIQELDILLHTIFESDCFQ